MRDAGVPVIGVSGTFRGPQAAGDVLRLGAADFFEKPFPVLGLMARAARLMGRGLAGAGRAGGRGDRRHPAGRRRGARPAHRGRAVPGPGPPGRARHHAVRARPLAGRPAPGHPAPPPPSPAPPSTTPRRRGQTWPRPARRACWWRCTRPRPPARSRSPAGRSENHPGGAGGAGLRRLQPRRRAVRRHLREAPADLRGGAGPPAPGRARRADRRPAGEGGPADPPQPRRAGARPGAGHRLVHLRVDRGALRLPAGPPARRAAAARALHGRPAAGGDGAGLHPAPPGRRPAGRDPPGPVARTRPSSSTRSGCAPARPTCSRSATAPRA